MALEILRENFKTNVVIGENTASTVLENDIVISDTKPDIEQLLLVNGEVFVNKAELTKNKVNIIGTVRYKILYRSNESLNNIKSINNNYDFNCWIEMNNANEDMICKANCEIEHIEYSILNSRKIKVNSIIKADAKIIYATEHNPVLNFEGIENSQLLKDKLSVNCYLGENKNNYIINEILDIPSSKPTIKEILRTDIKISDKEHEINNDKIEVKGILNITTLYIADDEQESIQFMEHGVPFKEIVELSDISENALCDVDYRIVDYQFEAGEDNDGELRTINGKVIINISAMLYERINKEILIDAFASNVRLEIEKREFVIENEIFENDSQIIFKDIINVNNDNSGIIEVFNIICKPRMTENIIKDNKFIIEGFVNSNILYLSNNNENPLLCNIQDIPFKHSIDMDITEENMEKTVDMDIEHCNYSLINSNEIELRMVIKVKTKITKKSTIPLIVNISENDNIGKKDNKQPSITLYFTQPGDTLWKIAKKYLTAIEDIKNINSINEKDKIIAGQQITIPKK